MSQDSENEEEIFDRAINIIDPSAREAYLTQACSGRPDLRTVVEELLAFHDTADDVLGQPVIQFESLGAGEDELIDTVIGNYRILSRIAEGGFGTVYRAEQFEPIQRIVALKVIKNIQKTEALVGQFERERQTLALMNHANIAAVFDAGVTENGSPYFVMELVDGIPVDEFCDSARLSIRSRLELFLSVCRAIQHAHHKSIVHRDLKPSNVLVAMEQPADRAVPKVIDFGIATTVQPSGHQSSDPMVAIGTPEYMSPDQVSGVDIDTRADIYGLGGLLYKLLTGSPPLTLGKMEKDKAAQCIMEQIPLTPSQHVTDQADRSNEWYSARNTTNKAQLSKVLKNDLDAIVLKALEKSRSARYESVGQLIDDIERHLRNEPVAAADSDWRYRISKFVIRNRLMVSAATLICVAILGGTCAAAIGYFRAEGLRVIADQRRGQAEKRRIEAESEREKAEAAQRLADTMAKKSQRIAETLESLIGAAHPDNDHAADYTVREMLNDFSEEGFDYLTDQPEVEIHLRRALGRAYWRLGEMKRVGPQFERAYELSKRTYGTDNIVTITSQVDVARYYTIVSKLDEALELIQPALKRIGEFPPEEAQVWALFVKSHTFDRRGQHRLSEKAIQEVLVMSQTVFGEDHPTTLWFESWLVYAVFQRSRFDLAERMARQTMERQSMILGDEHPTVASTQKVLGMILLSKKDFVHAEEWLRRALEIHSRKLGPRSSQVARELVSLAWVSRDLGRRSEAEQLARQSVEIADELSMDRQFIQVRAHRTLAMILQESELDESMRHWQIALDTQRAIARSHPLMVNMLTSYSKALRQNGFVEDAIKAIQESIEISSQLNTKSKPSFQLHRLANCLRQIGLNDDALDGYEQAIAAGGGTTRDLFPWLDRVDLLVELSRFEEVKLLVEQFEQLIGENPTGPDLVARRILNAMILMTEGEFTRASGLLAAAARMSMRQRNLRAAGRAGTLEAECLIGRKRFDEAEKLLKRLDRQVHLLKVTHYEDELLIARRFVMLYTAKNDPTNAELWRKRVRGESTPD